MRRARFTTSAALLLAALFGAPHCGNGVPVPEAAPTETDSRATRDTPQAPRDASAPKANTADAPVAAKGTAPEDTWTTLYAFAQHLDAAHLHANGLLIDFGTPGRDKYTYGSWKSGWRGNYTQDGTSFSYLSASAGRIFALLPSDQSPDGRIVLRGKGIGTRKGRIYINNALAGTFAFDSSDWEHAEINIAKGLRPGMNEILVRADGQGRAHDGLRASIALDFLRLLSAKDVAETTQGPASSGVEAFAVTGPHQAPQLLLRSGESLTWHLPLQPEWHLVVRAKSQGDGAEDARLTITAQGDDGTPQVLAQLKLGPQTTAQRIPLSALSSGLFALRLHSAHREVLLEQCELQQRHVEMPKAPGRLNAQNIVVVLIDTLRADKLRAYNPASRVQTPFLDAFTPSAMVFTRPLAAENWTKPATASVLSGLYPQTHQSKTERNIVPNTVTLMSEHFQRLGWITAGFVANGYVSNKFGFQRGWDHWTNYVREGKVNRAQAVADDVIAWLEKRPANKPFFLYVHTIDPHVPYIPPNKYRALYDNDPYNGIVEPRGTAKLLERIKGGLKLSDRDKVRLEALYDGEISYHDDHLQRMHDALKQQGLLEDTAFIVTSDHGEEFFEHNSVGHGHSMYQELLHVPLIVQLPGATDFAEPARCDVDVSHTDIMPTVCELTGTECPKDVEGESLVPLLRGEHHVRYPSAAFSEFMDGQRVVRMGRWKLIVRGWRTTVFDLEQDPRETTDLSDLRPVSLAALKDALSLHLGRFDRYDNAAAATGSTATKARHKAADVVIDSETRKQLEALGYMGH